MKHRILLVLFAALLLVLVFGACAERHVYGDWIDETLATCTENGFRGHYHCEHCGKNFTVEKIEISDEELVIPATGHAWDNGTITTPATCTADGTKTYTCTNPNCGKIKTETIPAGHSFGKWIPGTEATASTPGEKGRYHCSVCEKDFDEDKQTELTDLVIRPLAHDYGEKNDEIPATCTATGTKAHYICTCCGKIFDETFTEVAAADLIISATGNHTYVWVDATAETCGQDGNVGHYHCSVCEKNFDETKQTELTDVVIRATGNHTYVWVDATAETCGAEGTLGHYHCSVCSKDFDADKNELATIVTAPATGNHTYGTLIETTPHTCEEDGELAHYHCSVCGKDFDATEDKNELESIVDPARHNYGEWIAEKQATNDEVGHVGHYHCDVCGKNFDKDHNEIDNIVTTVWSPIV